MSGPKTQKTIDLLGNAQEPLEESVLVHLSNLTREEQQSLEATWPSIPLDKRRRMLSLMSEQAEEDVQLDFTAVFRRGLQDPDESVRRLSVDGLWEDEAITLIRPFLTMLRSDPSPLVRASAATALARFILQGELGYLTDERTHEILNTLMAIIADATLPIAIRRRAVEAIAYSSDERVQKIIARAYEDASEEMRLSALFAMGRSADDYWCGVVRAELANPNPAFRFEAVRAAGELADPKAVERLIVLLTDADPEVRQMSIWALGQIGGPHAMKALRLIGQSKNTTLRRLARDSIAELSLRDEITPGFVIESELVDEDEILDEDGFLREVDFPDDDEAFFEDEDEDDE
ncbi:MAG: HEAT repeat domain-containing protein [Ardenticatenales bacterium]|nr:HEAT repeat domain-containing protein [Ardenticatenales bacterium]